MSPTARTLAELRAIESLPSDWDGHGAIAPTPRVIKHAEVALSRLDSLGVPPDVTLPSAAGTILFEWETPLGSARLEIGRTTFGFYTSPSAGEPFLWGGDIGELDVDKLRPALATMVPGVAAALMAIIDRSFA